MTRSRFYKKSWRKDRRAGDAEEEAVLRKS